MWIVGYFWQGGPRELCGEWPSGGFMVNVAVLTDGEWAKLEPLFTGRRYRAMFKDSKEQHLAHSPEISPLPG